MADNIISLFGNEPREVTQKDWRKLANQAEKYDSEVINKFLAQPTLSVTKNSVFPQDQTPAQLDAPTLRLV